MSQDILKNEGDKWLSLACKGITNDDIGLKVEKIIVFKKSKAWEIIINSTKYISYQQIAKIQHQIRLKFPGVERIKVRITTSMDLDTIRVDFDALWVDLKEYIKHEMPSLSPWLDTCRYEWSNEVLSVYVDQTTILDILSHKNLNLFIEEWFFSIFMQQIKVKLCCNDNNLELVTDDYIRGKELENTKLAQDAIDTCFSEIDTKRAKGATKTKDIRSGNVILGKSIKDQPALIETLREDSGRSTIEGMIFDIESRELKGGKLLISIDATDYTSSITCKVFMEKEKGKELLGKLKRDSWYKFKGDCQYDKFQREIVIILNDIITTPPRARKDMAEHKRVELHLHTQMSSMDGVTPVAALVKRAAAWGHKAIAITDHGVVQAFPEAYAVGKAEGVKIIFGLEAYLVNDCKPIVQNSNDGDFNQTFVVLDIETTGLNKNLDEIIEIGAVKISNKKIIDTFQSFIRPSKDIPYKITKLTGITNDMVADAPRIEDVFSKFISFIDQAVLAAHNAPFDMGFIKEYARKSGDIVNHTVVDTLSLSRELLKDLKKHKLNLVADHLGIKQKNHHRALDDAEVTGKILLKFIEILESKDINSLNDINTFLGQKTNLNSLENYHAIILVKDYKGLKNLYTLISEAHLNYFYRKPRIPKSLLSKHREGLIIGSACEAGELYKAVLKKNGQEEINDIAKFYDYLEIQPLGNNEYLLREGIVESIEVLKDINRSIIDIGTKLGKRIVATGDVHFLDPHDEYFRRLLMSGQGFGDADKQAPLYYKTTEEMLLEFSYLGQDVASQVVIHAPQSIVDEIEDIKPVPERLFPPEIPGAEDEITKMSMDSAVSIYGSPLPEVVEKRLSKELSSIISNGFAVLYLIAHRLVKKSMDDGYLVGSRGSVGSSFVATMTGITEVNPLPPHYICPNCKHSDFDIDAGKYGCGADLQDRECPMCESKYNKDGFDIPFEVFLGFKGDKVPDIDLNFSGEYQAIAHKYTEELFGQGYVFRAGTIGTIAEKTAFGFVKKYMDHKGMVVNNSEIKRLVKGCTGVKRTTGQHPGGILVVPKSRDIYEFTPVQYPADDRKSGTITSHFDFHAIHDTLVKLDILGHDDPTVIKMLEDITGVDARAIPIGEEKTMRLFSGTEPLGISPDDINSPVGTFGIPEFGTKFVRQMLLDTKPTTFAELIRISGLSHGTDVWLNNAQDLVRNGIATLSEVISTRDDIMVYLIYNGLKPTSAFKIMENVRKGKGLTQEFIEEMKANQVPNWYIMSCDKIKYMFPKAHAAAYVIMAFRIAYFKVYYPEAFYAAYFTVRADDFDGALIFEGRIKVMEKIKELESMGNEISTKEKSILTILEVALEMFCRGFKFVPIDLYLSHSEKFIITEQGIRPPLNSLQGVGVNAANNIMEARKGMDFISIEDLRERTKVTKTVIEVLKDQGVLKNMPETSQISLF